MTPAPKTPPSPRLGQKLRALRRREGLTQQQLAERLKVSPAYLNLIENGKRPLPAHLLIALAQLFQLDLAAFAADDDVDLNSDLMEVFGDPLFDNAELVQGDIKEFAQSQPTVARATVTLYRAFRQARLGGSAVEGKIPDSESGIPSDDVSDFLQKHMNSFPDVEDLAESMRRDAGADRDELGRALVRYLEERLGVSVQVARAEIGREHV